MAAAWLPEARGAYWARYGAGAEEVAKLYDGARFSAHIHVADFFDFQAPPKYDAVIGNPPYIRYQDFAGFARAKGLEAALAQGVRLTRRLSELQGQDALILSAILCWVGVGDMLTRSEPRRNVSFAAMT